MTTTQIGKLAVRRSIEIDAAPERVWQEFASAERFRLWYTPEGGAALDCKHVEYEPRVGGVFETRGYHEWQGGQQDFGFDGEVIVFDPPRELTVSMKAKHMTWEGTCYLTFLLEPIAGGRTLATIVQHGFESFGDGGQNWYNAFESGWNMDVPNALRNLVETGRAG